MPLTRVIAPTLQAVTLAEAKAHLRVDVSDDDALITAMIVAATDVAEGITERALLPQTWQLTLDAIPCSGVIVLQRPTVTAVSTMKYVHASTGVLTTLAGTEYQLAAASDVTARLVPAYGKAWPAVQPSLESVQVRFMCGYADVASVPQAIKNWMLLQVAELYENRSLTERAKFVDFMLGPYSAPTF
jgi:uncharacterized phiE125 gp8 family phage protein